jgi:drug/metabolite transporter (DMT)-like permease
MLVYSGVVAGSFSLGGLAASEVDPRVLTVLRFAIAAGAMAGLALAGPGLRRAHLRAPWRWLLLGGLFGIYFVLMFAALRTAPAVSTAAIFTLTPLMAAGFAAVLLRQRLTGRMGLAMAVGAAGALWVVFRGDPAALMAMQLGRGEALFLLGCAAHALFTPLVARLNRGEPALVTTTLVMVGGGLLTLAASAPAMAATDWAALPPIVWIVAAYLGLGATGLSFLLLQFAALRLPSAKVMAYTYLIPSMVIAWDLALGATLPPGRVLPGVLLTAAALLLLLKQERGKA